MRWCNLAISSDDEPSTVGLYLLLLVIKIGPQPWTVSIKHFFGTRLGTWFQD